ncbi:hypothetical protein [Faecalispora anaeroviscerum]|uniref:hypothetical protein n=1 Tax=Faecalispora anaeroviscerum TaxID=2991836 RepID=UPI0024BBB07E|nr:hypothetical protein [Faecalispora anaeroviscerum]
MMKKMWIAFAVSCVLAIPIRLYQLMNFVDSKTGFFTDGNVTAAIVSVALVLGCAGILLLSYREKSISFTFGDLSGFPTVIFGGLSGAALLIYSLHQLMLVAAGRDNFYDDGLQQLPVWVQHPGLYGALALFGMLASINFLVLTWGLATGRNPYVALPAGALIVPLWSCLDLTVMFVRYTEVVNTIESLYSMFMVIFLLLCLFAQSRFWAGVDDLKSRRLMVSTSMCYGLLALTVTVPNLLMYAMGRGVFCSMSMESSVLYLVIALFLVSLGVKLACKGNADARHENQSVN